MSRIDRDDDVIGQLTPLRRYARSLVRGDGADDLVHDALVRAYERRATFRTGGDLRAWLLSILHSTFIDGRRRQSAELRRETEAAQLTEASLPPDQEGGVRLRQVHDAFMALPEEQRAVLHLVAVEGMSYQAAADTLGIPVGTLMSRLGRGRAALRAFEARGGLAALPAPPDAPLSPRPALRIVGGRHD